MICPPLGQEYNSSYRTLRYLADSLASVGLAALRFDYEGTGDSVGDTETPDRVEGWLRSVQVAVDYVRSEFPGPVAALGMRLGASLLVSVSRDQPSLDAMVLWDPVASAARWLHGQRVLAQLGAGVVPDDTHVEIAGMAFDTQSAGALRTLGTNGLADVIAAGTKVLAVTRSGARPVGEAADIVQLPAVQQLAVDGFDTVVDVEPVQALIPLAAVAATVEWLARTVTGPGHEIQPAQGPTTRLDGGSQCETVGRFGAPAVAGVVTKTAETTGPTVMFLGASDHRVGPGRQWVALSRNLVGRGIPCARFDVGGTGDGDRAYDDVEICYYTVEAVDDAVAAAKVVSPDDPSNVILVGLCAGAWTAMQAGLQLRCRAVYLLNPGVWHRAPLRIRPATDQGRSVGNDTVSRWRGTLRSAIPQRVGRLLDKMGATNGPVARIMSLGRCGVDVTVMLGESESAAFENLIDTAGADWLRPSTGTAWSRNGQARVRICRIPEMGHALLGRAGRAAAAEFLMSTLSADMGGYRRPVENWSSSLAAQEVHDPVALTSNAHQADESS